MKKKPTPQMASDFAFPEILIDLGVSYVEVYTPSLAPNELCAIRQAFDDYIRGRCDYEQCRLTFLRTVGRDDALARIRDIVNLPSDPIPFTEDARDEKLSVRKRTRTWTAQEDERLLGGVARFGLDNWQMVAAFLGNGRNRAQCSQRWTRGLDPRISKKSWSSEEDERLLQCVQQFGDKAWTKIAGALGNRSDVQCRYHFRQLVNESAQAERGMRKSQTVAQFRWKAAPQVAPARPASFMPLRYGRAFGSQPALRMQAPSALYDTMPVGSIQQVQLGGGAGVAQEEQRPTVRWGTPMGEQNGIDEFLRRFR